MVKVLVSYYTKGGSTEEMAEEVRDGVRDGGAEVELKRIEKVSNEDLEEVDALVIGSPTYYGNPAPQIHELFEQSNSIRGDLDKVVGAAFASSYHRAGGNETTIMSILQQMLIHNMVVVGDPIKTGGHYGAVSVCNEVDEQSKEECFELGKRVSEIAQKLN
ncbi:flavodoxin [archaeon SCG-AAA382B04]|nr:flavodoxin [archaeon SCG-AAA382B04]